MPVLCLAFCLRYTLALQTMDVSDEGVLPQIGSMFYECKQYLGSRASMSFGYSA
jgi:hypothetical protein